MEDQTPRRRASDRVPPTSVAPLPEVASRTLSTAREIKRALLGLIVATVVLYFAMIAIAYYVWNQNKTNTHALCAIRHDAQIRVNEGNTFLSAHPTGFLGISPAQLQQSISDSLTTVNALGELNCNGN